jgi:hypothetical protein
MEESNQGTKHSGSGGPSGQVGQTVRTGHADRPACCRGLSAHTPRTVRPCTADRPKKQIEPPETTPKNGPSAGNKQTVRQAPADRPPCTRGPSETSPNENSKPRRIETKGEQENEEHPTNRDGADYPPGPRGPSARCRQSRKCTTPKSPPPNHHRISQTVEAMETRVWGHEKHHTMML